jgi:hypothetical protein
VPEWQGLNDSKIAKQQVMAQSPVAGRSDKFEAEWNKNVDPTYFIMNRLSGDKRDQIVSDLQKTEEGAKDNRNMEANTRLSSGPRDQ